MVNVHTDGENITIHVTPTSQSTTVQASGTSTVGAVAGSSTRYYEQLAKEHMEQAGTYATQAGTSATLAGEYLDDTREVYSSVQAAGTEAVSVISEATSDSLGSISETTTEVLETISQATTTALEAATSASESAGSASASATEAARIAAEVIESAPRVTVTETATGATINVEDIHGTSSADISNGEDGEDGFSPSATVEKVGNKATITITDKDGTTTAEIYDGTGGASSFSQLDGSPYDNTNLANALNSKQPVGDYATETYVDTADNNLQTQIDAITSQSDVTDVVGTYAELVAYDKPLYVGDIIKVLNDSTQSGARSYYRNTGGTSGAYTFTLIGSESPSYTKSETDTLLQAKQNITDNTLTTTSKTIVGAINEVNAEADSLQTSKQDVLTAGDNITIEGNIISADGAILYDTTGQNTDGAMTQKATTDNLVLKTGDTMSGDLTIEKVSPYLYGKTSEIDYTSITAPSSHEYGLSLMSYDTNGNYFGGCRSRFANNNVFQTFIEAKRSISGTEIGASIIVGVNSNGKAVYSPVQLITTYVSGKSGYNIWSNGYCEQWGSTNVSARGTGTITLTKTFKDTNYNLVTNQYSSSEGTTYNNAMKSYKSSASKIGYDSSSNANAFVLDWKVCGYLAEGQY